MPLNIGDSNSSRSLVSWEKYKDKQLKIDRDTRIDIDAMQWLITITGGVTYCIKFSGNFHKKHLYTSSKKPESVQAEYDKLGSISDDSARWVAAQEAADQTKFRTQHGHRSRDEQDCVTCGHPVAQHTGGGTACTRVTKSIGPTGAVKNNKPVRGEISTACTCQAYVSKYGEKRGTLQGKPSINPLLGATSAGANDVIWMDKIPRSHFEAVIVAAIEKRVGELAVAKKSWDAAGEHVEWDFGALHKGCILKIDQATSLQGAKAKGYSAVDILMTMDNTDVKRPIFTAGHLTGSKTR